MFAFIGDWANHHTRAIHQETASTSCKCLRCTHPRRCQPARLEAQSCVYVSCDPLNVLELLCAERLAYKVCHDVYLREALTGPISFSSYRTGIHINFLYQASTGHDSDHTHNTDLSSPHQSLTSNRRDACPEPPCPEMVLARQLESTVTIPPRNKPLVELLDFFSSPLKVLLQVTQASIRPDFFLHRRRCPNAVVKR